jgi:molybdate/tungstate transport system substrate-binding protein
VRSSLRNRGVCSGSIGVVVTALVALLVGACGGGSATGSRAPSSSSSGSGPVSVLYAGSLVNLMEHDLGPKFASASGYTYQGQGAGSTALANQIKSKTKRAGVFISASPSVNDQLMGEFESWYATFATAPLVLGYNPHSRFTPAWKTQPWQQVISQSGFRLGRTDPVIDPKGRLAVQALQRVGLGNLAAGAQGVYPETELVGRLQAGQLDAGFFYRNEAVEAGIPTVALDPVMLRATYTVSVLRDASDEAGAVAFVSYLLGPRGTVILRQHGLDVVSPSKVTGDKAAVPAPLRPVLGG